MASYSLILLSLTHEGPLSLLLFLICLNLGACDWIICQRAHLWIRQIFFSQYPLIACNSLPRGRALQEFPHLHWHAVWFCISKGNTEFPLSKYGVVLGCFTGDFCQVEEVCFYSYFLNISSLDFVNHERLLDFVTCFFCIFSGNFVVLILPSIDKLHYMDWFSDIRLILHSWTTLFTWLSCRVLFICCGS